LMQVLTQSLFFSDDPLQQLPILTNRELSKFRKKNIKTLLAFKKTPRAEKAKICPDITPEDWDTIEQASNLLPSVDVKCKIGVEDEEGIYEGDMVKVDIKMTRMTQEEVMHGMKTPEEKKDEEKEEKEDDDDEEEILLPTPPKNRLAVIKPTSYAYAPYFPYAKKESWYIFLLEKTAKGQERMLGFKRVDTMDREEDVVLYIPIQKAGIHTYEIYLCSDSYMGIDKRLIVNLKAGKKADLEAKKAAEEEDESDDEDLDEPEEEWSQWWDVLVLILLAIFAYNWLQAKGYWAIYADPIILKLRILFKPLADRIYPTIQPVWDPLTDGVSKLYERMGLLLTREFPEDPVD